MKSYEDNLMDFIPIQNKNSKEFDVGILEKLKQIKVPACKFDTEVRKIMREKSSCKLWLEHEVREKWDYDKLIMREINFTCCPVSRKAKNYFCLILDNINGIISVKDGFLCSV